MDVFEVKRQNKEVYFGDLEDLKRVQNKDFYGFGRSPFVIKS